MYPVNGRTSVCVAAKCVEISSKLALCELQACLDVYLDHKCVTLNYGISQDRSLPTSLLTVCISGFIFVLRMSEFKHFRIPVIHASRKQTRNAKIFRNDSKTVGKRSTTLEI